MTILNKTELAWAAGFYDGEGSTVIGRPSKNTTCQFRVQIGQTDPAVLERFKDAVGGLGNVTGPYLKKNTNHRPSWMFSSAKFEESQAIIAMLWKYLSPVKQTQAKQALKFYLNEAVEVRQKPNWRLSGVALWSKMWQQGLPLPEGAKLPKLKSEH